jgi:hypothetical protein
VLTAAAIQCLVWIVRAPAELLTAKFPCCYPPCCRLYPPWPFQVSRWCSTLLVAARCSRPSNVWPGALSTWSLALQLETYQRSGCCALRHQQQHAEVSTARGSGDNRQRPDCCSECSPAAQSCFSAGRTGPYVVLLARSRTLMLLTAVRAGMLRTCCMAGGRWVSLTPVQGSSVTSSGYEHVDDDHHAAQSVCCAGRCRCQPTCCLSRTPQCTECSGAVI